MSLGFHYAVCIISFLPLVTKCDLSQETRHFKAYGLLFIFDLKPLGRKFKSLVLKWTCDENSLETQLSHPGCGENWISSLCAVRMTWHCLHPLSSRKLLV